MLNAKTEIGLNRWIHPLIWLVFMALWAQPTAYNQAKVQWESLGDAHFYAQSSEFWAQQNELRWFEIYPIALKMDSGFDLAFPAPGHCGVSSLLVRLGWTGPEAVLWVSSVSIVILATLLFWLGFSYWQSPVLAWSMGLSLGLSSTAWDFAVSGGSDALGLVLFGLSVLFLYAHQQEQRLKFWIWALVTAIFAALTRPQGQLLLFGSILLLVQRPWDKSKLRAAALWLGAMLGYKFLQLLGLHGKPLVFPYAFSFLVGTEPWPGHSLFREYFSEGFGLAQVWDHRDLWAGKSELGWRLLKQYWDGWLFSGAVFLLGLRHRKTRSLSFLLGLLLLALMLLSATGHLIPRYWTFMAPIALFMAWVEAFPYIVKWNNTSWRWAMPALIFIALVASDSPWLKWPHQAKIHPLAIPSDILKSCEGFDWLACDRPAKAIDALKRPILLLPNSIEELQDIHQEVHDIGAILLSPFLEKGELHSWSNRGEDLEALGFQLLQEDGWRLYRRKI